MVHGPVSLSTVASAAAFRDALAAFGSGAEGIELPGDFDEASGHRAGQELLAAGALPDAVFAANDMMALGCLFACQQAGVDVPGEIAVAGFDDIPLARYTHPSLTTMRVDIAGIGAQAMRMLLRRLGAEVDADTAPSTLKAQLIARESTQRRDRATS